MQKYQANYKTVSEELATLEHKYMTLQESMDNLREQHKKSNDDWQNKYNALVAEKQELASRPTFTETEFTQRIVALEGDNRRMR